MRLPDEVQKCVVFLGRRTSDKEKFIPSGTGFLVSYPSPHTDGFNMTYLVTAKHVADYLGPVFDIRFNTKKGEAEHVQINGKKWFNHPSDHSVDAAIFPWSPPEHADFKWIHYDTLFLSEKKREGKEVGVGDEVYVTGLFSPAMGLTRNTPIVRSGHLAMSPPEDVPIRNWATQTMSAYLIEMRSLGGLSGSPVFVQRSIQVQKIQTSGRIPLAAGAIFLLGVLHGHWNVRHLDLDYVSPPIGGEKEDLLNAGVAIVTPVDKLIEIITQPDLEMSLAEAEHEALNNHPYFLDGGSPERFLEASAGPMRVAVSASSAFSKMR